MRKDKSRISLLSIICFIVVFVGMLWVLVSGTNKERIEIVSHKLYIVDDNTAKVTYRGPEGAYILISNTNNISIKSNGWKTTRNKEYTFPLSNELQYYYLMYNGKTYYVGSNKDIGYVKPSIENDDKYLIVGGSYNVDYKIDEIGYVENIKQEWKSSNNKVASVNNGIIKAISPGKVTISLLVNGKKAKTDYIVTDLITKMPKEYDVNKELLPCGLYSKSDNDTIDEILKYRIDNAGYQTRAGVIAAARFLLLEFPYRLPYFYEWGRHDTKVDGEGRYYFEGLYLNDSRFKRLSGSNSGPATWGCKLYSNNVLTYSNNGLDCSGFVTWALLNGGFDIGDIGAGFAPEHDLTEVGELISNSKENINKLKVGDLVHSNYMGGHIGLLIGTKDNQYYVAQATPNKNWGLTITKYTIDEFIKEWPDIVLMDKVYLQDGIYSNYW